MIIAGSLLVSLPSQALDLGPYMSPSFEAGNSKVWVDEYGQYSTTTTLPGTILFNGARVNVRQTLIGGVFEDEYYFGRDSFGFYYYGSRYRDLHGDHGFADFTSTLTPPILDLPASAEIGDRFSSSSIMGQAVTPDNTLVTETYYSDYFETLTIEAFETVSVPLGSFNALRVRYDTHISDPDYDDGETETSYAWYAPHIGSIKFAVLDRYGDLVVTDELVSIDFTVPESPCAGLAYESTPDNLQWGCRGYDTFYCVDILDRDGNMFHRAAACGEGLHRVSPASLNLPPGTYGWRVWSETGLGGPGFEGTFSNLPGTPPHASTYERISWGSREGGGDYYCLDICDTAWNVYEGFRAVECGSDFHSWSPKAYVNDVLGAPDPSGLTFRWRIWSPGGYGGPGFEGEITVP